MKTVCVKNMPFAEEAFSTLGETRVLEGRAITASDMRECDILAIRSTTKVDAALLEGSSVKFVGTATIGTDHLDIAYLTKRGIHWCYAPGCNANSVSEYITTALLCLADRHNFSLSDKTIGVIGVGNVGRRVVSKAKALGMRVLQNDPPRQRRENPATTDFSDLSTILREADIITLHVPITREGPDKTLHLADKAFFAAMKPGSIFINAARGAVVESGALLKAISSGHIAHCVLDTWEGEPAIRRDLLEAVDIATPHIAGHSFEGKVAGTVMVYEEACRYFKLEPQWTPAPLMPPPLVPQITIEPQPSESVESTLWRIVRQVYNIEADDAALRQKTDDLAVHFDNLRKNYPVRREFRFTNVAAKTNQSDLLNICKNLGFRTRGDK